ncbi:tetratricopeptide (TPR) repeat protein [Pedobacter sp. UYEF25]
MMKIAAAFIAMLISFSAVAQSIEKLDSQDQNIGGTAINIAISKYDLSDGNTLYDEATGFEQKGDFNHALPLFGKAAFEYSVVKNYNKYGQAVIKMSDMHFKLGNFKEAEDILLNVAVKNYSKLHSTPGLMNTYNLLGNTLLAQNKYTQSMWFYTQQGILAKQLGNQNSFIVSLLGVVQVKIKKKDFSLALRDLKSAESLAKAKNARQFGDEISAARRTIAGKLALKD